MANTATQAAVILALMGCASSGAGSVRAPSVPEAPPRGTSELAPDASMASGRAALDATEAPLAPVVSVAPAVPSVPGVPPGPLPGAVPESNEIVVSATSDLPTGSASGGTFAQAVERAVGPYASRLTECMRSIVPRQRRLYRVMIDEEGQVIERPPQSFALSLRAQECVRGVLRGLVVSPAPPRGLPYDISIEAAVDRAIPSRR